ncbi:MAG: cupredoxin domain-containing protein [Sphingomonadales bacterium]|nr:cupredoxin domain-containing protein [Sphingomonadales bacterium]
MLRHTLVALSLAAGAAAYADSPAPPQVVTLTLQDHRFVPAVITIPAGQRVKIDLTNRDATGDDFDSDDLHVDKDVAPHGRVAFFIGPLKPGTYAFKAELHAATAQGKVVVVEKP